MMQTLVETQKLGNGIDDWDNCSRDKKRNESEGLSLKKKPESGEIISSREIIQKTELG